MSKGISCESSGAVYGLGFIGAAVYYLGSSPTFLAGVFGIVKALLWPGFLVYELFSFLGV